MSSFSSKYGDNPAKVLCVGQSSRAIGRELEQISTTLSGIHGPEISYITDEIQQGSNPARSVRLLKCAHTLTELTEYCSVCSKNSEILQDTVMRNLLEQTDTSASLDKICIISDVYTQFSTWCSSIAMEYIRDECSLNEGFNGHNGGLISILAKPPMGFSTGLENLYSLLSTHHSLVTADATIFRGMESSTTQMSTKNTPVQSSGTWGIACDLYPILCSTDATTTTAAGNTTTSAQTSHKGGYDTLQSYLTQPYKTQDMQYHLWPVDICTAQSHIIDVRSSLAALLKRLLKQQHNPTKNISGAEYNPLRSLSSNIHALHLAYTELYPSMTMTTPIPIYSANYANFLLSDTMILSTQNHTHRAVYIHSQRMCLPFTDVKYSEHELAVALGWATPGIFWPYNKSKDEHSGVNNTNHSSRDTGNSHSSSVLTGRIEGNSVVNESSGVGKLGISKEMNKLVNIPLNAVNTGTRSSSSTNSTIGEENVNVLNTSQASSYLSNTARLRSQRNSISSSHSISSNMTNRTDKFSRNHNNNNNSSCSSRNMYSLNASMNKAILNNTDNNSNNSNNKQHDVSCIVFDTPYGKQDCQHICTSSKQLLSIGAYKHL